MRYGKAVWCVLLLAALGVAWGGRARAVEAGAGEAAAAATGADRTAAGAVQEQSGGAGAGTPEPGTPPAQGPRFQPPPAELPPITRVAPGIFRIGTVQIHKQARSVTFPAQVNMDRGLLEYLLVQSSGKTHESLLRTSVDPYVLQLAFLLLGFEGSDRPAADQGSAEQLKGEPVTVTIHHRGEAGSKTSAQVAPEDWLTVKRDGSDDKCPPLPWIYTGSRVAEGKFLAQVQGSIIALYHDSTALVDHSAAEGASDEVWFAREGTVPKPGTPVVVVIKRK